MVGSLIDVGGGTSGEGVAAVESGSPHSANGDGGAQPDALV